MRGSSTWYSVWSREAYGGCGARGSTVSGQDSDIWGLWSAEGGQLGAGHYTPGRYFSAEATKELGTGRGIERRLPVQAVSHLAAVAEASAGAFPIPAAYCSEENSCTGYVQAMPPQ